MIKLDIEEMKKINCFFIENYFHMGKCVLQGLMGEAYTDNLQYPNFAFLFFRSYCLIGGKPTEEAMKQLELLPINVETIVANPIWYDTIEKILGTSFLQSKRYLLKEKNHFNIQKLQQNIRLLNEKYKLYLIDETIYNQIININSLVCNMNITDDYLKKGIGICCFYEKNIVGIASSNIIYKNGIEVNIRVDEQYRSQHIATAMASKLILECIERNLKVSWDAANLFSLSLAKKLGYELENSYTIYYRI